METARKRIIDFIENQGIRPSEFLANTGLKKGFVDRSHQNSGISDVYMSKILETYPEINPEWLLTGKGEMIRKKESKTQGSETKDDYIIRLQREKIEELEKKVKKLKKELSSPSTYPNVAEPDH